jgi:hypothetical protein
MKPTFSLQQTNNLHNNFPNQATNLNIHNVPTVHVVIPKDGIITIIVIQVAVTAITHIHIVLPVLTRTTFTNQSH